MLLRYADAMEHDPDAVTVTAVQPYRARKTYVCPGCESRIDVGIGHVVVVPVAAPDLRRHWHRGCWFKEERRRGSSDPG